VPDASWVAWAVTGSSIGAALLAAGHAVVYKRDPRSATMWVLLVALLPLGGPLLYLLFGINRTQRRAQRLRGESVALRPAEPDVPAGVPQEWRGFARLVGRATEVPLTAGNRIEPLCGGAAAYPAMFEAIEGARHSVALASYIFDRDGIGERFVEALARAHRRGVRVRVLIDDVHVRLSRSSAYPLLARAGVPVASFNATVIPARLHAINLRNHRKILVVDGALGFTGGMNVHRPYFRPDAPAQAYRDLHFRLEGPVVMHLRQTFARDWSDTTREALDDDFWGARPAPLAGATALARGIEAGPDETIDRLRWTFMGALAAARQSVYIWTPYFVPDQPILAALSTAALRGVAVRVLTPAASDHAFVRWAARAHYWQVLEHGARIFERSGPFDHTKLMLVDGEWLCLGSANWDARSLRLNFEFNVEAYDARLCAALQQVFADALAEAREVDPQALAARPLPVKLRDGVARLFTPIL